LIQFSYFVVYAFKSLKRQSAIPFIVNLLKNKANIYVIINAKIAGSKAIYQTPEEVYFNFA